MSSAKNTVLGSYDLNQLVSTNPDEVRLAEIEKYDRRAPSPQARNSFGIAIEQVGISLTLPECKHPLFEAGCARSARNLPPAIAPKADRKPTEFARRPMRRRRLILAEAKVFRRNPRKAQRMPRASGAAAHSKDPDFYKFSSEIEALKKVVNQNTTIVLDTNSPGAVRFARRKAGAPNAAPVTTPGAMKLKEDAFLRPRDFPRCVAL